MRYKSITSRVYLGLAFSFSLLFFALYLSYQSVEENSKVIKFLERDQIELNFYTNKLNYDIKNNQARILQLSILQDTFSNLEDHKIYNKIHHSAHKLEQYQNEHPHIDKKFALIISKIHKRIIAYKAVQDSVIESIKSKDNEDIKDSIIGFNDITMKFSKEINTLVEVNNELIYSRILELKDNNKENIKNTLLSFMASIFIIIFSAYKFLILQNNLSRQLQRAEDAEEEQRKLQHQLLQYNEDLENEVIKKTKEIREKIYTHFLTGLPNRNQLIEDSRKDPFTSLAFLNIDKFQSFNDVYGEETGNIALKMSAEFLSEKVNETTLSLYHIGGDEFALTATKNTHLNRNNFIQIIETILQEYKDQTFVYDQKKFNFMMSSGVAFNNQKILAYADMALKNAKKQNLPLSVFEDDKLLEKIHQESIECHKKLLNAIETDNIVSFFQPLIPIQDNTKVAKYESLVRLKEDNGNIILPFNFIEVARANRIYHKVTRAVINNTLEVVSKYKVPCSINFSLNDLSNEKTMKLFFKILDRYEHNELITIELLETEDFSNYQADYDFCIKVRSYGLKIALDDFGSGYSNFSHLIHLPIDYIKIDATLISNIDRDNNSIIMVETIVSLAKKLHVETIAEFVSSKEILKVVKSLGVDYAQGFYLGKPEPIENHLKRQ